MFWSRLETDYPKSAALVQRHNGKHPNADVVRDLIKVYDATKNGGTNRGKRDLNRRKRPAEQEGSAPKSSTGTAKGKGKVKVKGNDGGCLQPYEMDCVGSDDMFWLEDDAGDRCSAKRFAVADLSLDSEGFCVDSFYGARIQLNPRSRAIHQIMRHPVQEDFI
jgi:hypothetical protein